ncbi:hypothetical protein CN367_11780 [Priestia megaterium]|uniref:hypothetical protein n=1 Tax=Priestia megaterium TaxID=1404 RepID=UPI000BFA31CB|nr:hypothetical protein [Priestia megaterium]PEZ47040.1 hypothetical protein CN367_11780 [Priestia megaterium]
MLERFYFYNTRGGELKDHQLNGVILSTGGAYLVTPEDEGWKIKKTHTVKGLLPSRTELGYLTSLTTFDETKITINDFEGHDRVLVKVWSVEGNEWFILEAKQDHEKYADKVTMLREFLKDT